MNESATLTAAPIPVPGRSSLTGGDRRAFPGSAVAVATVAVLTGAGAYVAFNEPYGAGSPLGYNLGLVGGVLMLMLLPYALRKRLRCLRQVGTMRGWFLFHIAAGLVGPLLVLFHTTFRIGSFNGGVALASTLLVTCSGLVGRFFYRKVHRGLSGSRASLAEFEAALQRQVDALQAHADLLPAVMAEVGRYIEAATATPPTRRQGAARFLTLGTDRLLASRRVRSAVRSARGRAAAHGRELDQLMVTVDAALAAAQRTAQFSGYERLFALWHVVHIPFLFLLVLSSVVHVVAVHAY